MRALPLLLVLAGVCESNASPTPIVGPGNLLTYNDYNLSLPPGDLNLDLDNFLLPAKASIGPTDPLTIVFNFAAPVSLTLEPDYVHHDTVAYTFVDSADLLGMTYDPKKGSFYGTVGISLDYDGALVLAPPSLYQEGPYYNYNDSDSATIDESFGDVFTSPTYLVPFGPPLTFTFNSAVFEFTQSENVTVEGFSANIDGYLPDSMSTFAILGFTAAALLVIRKWPGMDSASSPTF